MKTIFGSFIFLICTLSIGYGYAIDNTQGRSTNTANLPTQSHDSLHTPAQILAQTETTFPDGSFNSSYETSDGTKVENYGFFKKIQVPQYQDVNGKVVEAHEENILVQKGSYTYADPNGEIIQLNYVADENGFQPTGNHLPKTDEQLRYEQYNQQSVNRKNSPQRYTRQTHSYVPGVGITENRPIVDYRTPPYWYQNRPIGQGFYYSNGGLDQTVISTPSHGTGYYPNGMGLSQTVVSSPSYSSGYYPNGGKLSETVISTPSQGSGYYPSNGGLSQTVISKPSFRSSGHSLGETLYTSPSTYNAYYYQPNGQISETITSKPSSPINCNPYSNQIGGVYQQNQQYPTLYYQNRGLQETITTNPSFSTRYYGNNPCYYSNGGSIGNVITKPIGNPCYYYPKPNINPCYPSHSGLSSSITTNPSNLQTSVEISGGLGENINTKPVGSTNNYEGNIDSLPSGNIPSSNTENAKLISGHTNRVYEEDLSPLQRTGSIQHSSSFASTQSTSESTTKVTSGIVSNTTS